MLIKLKMVKFSNNIAFEVLEYNGILEKYKGFFNISNGVVTYDDNIKNEIDFFITFYEGSSRSSTFGGRGWCLRISQIKKLMISSSSFNNIDEQFNKMTSNLDLVINYIKEREI